MARNELAATLTSSAVCRSVTLTGVPGRDHRRERGPQLLLGPRRGDAEDEPVGVHRVVDGEALAQELRVPGQLDLVAGRRQPADQVGQPRGGAHRHRRLADHQRPARQVRRQRRRTPRRRSVMSAASEPACCGVPTQMKCTSPNSAASSYEVVNRSRPDSSALTSSSGSPGSKKGTSPEARRATFRCVDVDTEHLEAQHGHADRVGGAEVAGADDGEARVLHRYLQYCRVSRKGHYSIPPGRLSPSRRKRARCPDRGRTPNCQANAFRPVSCWPITS